MKKDLIRTPMKNNQIAWLGKPETRILNIRAFRKYIDTLPFDAAVSVTQYIWETSPRLNKIHFNIANVEEWPNPWELFSQTAYCSNSQTLGAFYTLILSEHVKEHEIGLAIINDTILGEQVKIITEKTQEFSKDMLVIKASDITYKLGD
jgi:hypothetical protein